MIDNNTSKSQFDFNYDSLYAGEQSDLNIMEQFFHEYVELLPELSREQSNILLKDLDFILKSKGFRIVDLKPEDVSVFPAAAFFKPGFHISVIPHMRYSPVFLHMHEFYEITYIFHGCCCNQIDGTDIIMEADSMPVIVPGKIHKFNTIGDDAYAVNYLITTSCFDRMLDMIYLRNTAEFDSIYQSLIQIKTDKYYIFSHLENPRLRKLLIDIMKDYYTSDSAFLSTLLDTKVTEALLIFFDQYYRHLESTESFEIQAKGKRRIGKIINTIRNNYPNKSRKDIAVEFGYSERQLARILKNSTGKTFSEIVDKFRINDTVKYFGNSALSIKEIARLTGFHTEKSFDQWFKNKFQVTPTEYRKRMFL